MATATTTTEQHVIDATGKSLGRVASEAATILLGKHRPTFTRNVAADVEVRIAHVSRLQMSERKRNQKLYTHYTGYPGGLRMKQMSEVIARKGYTEVIRQAVYGMLPSNKLRAQRMKKLIIEE